MLARWNQKKRVRNCSYSKRRSLFIHADLLLSLLDFLFVEKDRSWAECKSSLKMSQLSWTCLFSRAISHVILPSRSLDLWMHRRITLHLKHIKLDLHYPLEMNIIGKWGLVSKARHLLVPSKCWQLTSVEQLNSKEPKELEQGQQMQETQHHWMSQSSKMRPQADMEERRSEG